MFLFTQDLSILYYRTHKFVNLHAWPQPGQDRIGSEHSKITTN